MIWIVTVMMAITTGAGPASAHAFLVSSDPAQGARLAAPPSIIVLRFTEAVVIASTTVDVHLAEGQRLLAATVTVGRDDHTVDVTVGVAPPGIYEVSWQTLSADDGHASAGEFAFAAGKAGGAIPAAEQGAGSSNVAATIATALFLLGLAAALGGALTLLAVDRQERRANAGVRAGLLGASIGALISFANDVSRQAHGLSHASILTAIAALLVSLAMLVHARTRRLLPIVVVALAAAGVVWAAMSHPAITGGALGLAINSIHLVLGTAWVGLLAYLLVAVVRREARAGADLVATVGAYARLALPMVVVLAAAGALSAWEVLPSWSSLYDSGYGQLLLVKTGLFVLALALAFVGRARGLRLSRGGLLANTIPLEATAVAVVLVVTAVLANTAPPVSAQPLGELLGPAPLAGPVVRSAGLAGQLTVGVAAGSGQLQIQVTAPDHSPLDPHVDIDAYIPSGQDVGLFPRPCGNGCFTEHYTLPVGVTRLVISAAAHGWTGGTLTTNLAWPPSTPDPRLLQNVVEVMDRQASVATRETVTSNTRGPSFTQSFPAVTGRRLVSLEPYGSADEPGETAPITDVTRLTVGGPGIQLYLPGEPLWVTIWLDPQGRIARQQIVSVGHLITDTYTYP